MRVSHPSSQRTTGLCTDISKFRNNTEPLLPLQPRPGWLAAWMASDLSKLDLLIIQIDGLHIGNAPGAGRRPGHRRQRRQASARLG
jgi:hypothetical protein